MSGEDAAKPLKKISLEEFQKVNDEWQKDKTKPLWMVMRGKVIDVTDYQEDHPGQSAAVKISFFTAFRFCRFRLYSAREVWCTTALCDPFYSRPDSC